MPPGAPRVWCWHLPVSVLGVSLCWLLLALPVGICIPEGEQDVEVEGAWALSLGLCCD